MKHWLDAIADDARADAIGMSSFDNHCIDCGLNTTPAIWTDVRTCAPAIPNTWEMYWVKDDVWAAAGMDELDGSLCVGCIEARLGRRLRPKDFDHSRGENHHGSSVDTPRLKSRKGLLNGNY